jgi:hypothetical protein
MKNDKAPTKLAVRTWLLARFKSREPLPEREVMLRELSDLSAAKELASVQSTQHRQ